MPSAIAHTFPMSPSSRHTCLPTGAQPQASMRPPRQIRAQDSPASVAIASPQSRANDSINRACMSWEEMPSTYTRSAVASRCGQTWPAGARRSAKREQCSAAFLEPQLPVRHKLARSSPWWSRYHFVFLRGLPHLCFRLPITITDMQSAWAAPRQHELYRSVLPWAFHPLSADLSLHDRCQLCHRVGKGESGAANGGGRIRELTAAGFSHSLDQMMIV